MKPPHPNTHLVEAVIKALQARQLQKRITVSLIASTLKIDHPNTSIPSDRTIASIKKRMEAPETPLANLCPDCKGYGYIYEQSARYFGDGTELSAPNRPHTEIPCAICERSGIDPLWNKPLTNLITKAGSPTQIAQREAFVASQIAPLEQDIPEPDGYDESLERTL